MSVTKPRKAPLDPWLVTAEERERREAEHKRREEEKLRPFKRSEFEEMSRRLHEEGELDRFLALNNAANEAKQRGLWIDDVAPTLANLKARFPDGRVISSSTASLAMAWARKMDRDVWPKEAAAAREKGLPEPMRYATAVLDWWGKMAHEGRIATEGPDRYLGVIYEAALPAWATELLGGFGTRSISRDAPESTANAVAVKLQANRFGAMEESFRLLADMVRQGAKGLDALPPALPGMNWDPWQDPANPPTGQRQHHSETAQTLLWIESNEVRVREERAAQARAEWEAQHPVNSSAANKLANLNGSGL